MTIRKEKDSGRWFLFWRLPKRARRSGYQPVPLARDRNRIMGFLVDLFRGGPSPLLASPIATSIDRKIKVERQARAAARSGNKGEARRLTDRIEEALSNWLTESQKRADGVLDQLKLDTDREEVEIKNCRPASLYGDLKVELNKIIGHVDSHLKVPASQLASEERTFRNFTREYRLKEKWPHWGTKITRSGIQALVIISILELIINAAFFSGTRPGGFIEALGLAAMLSIATILLGVGFGWAYQFSDYRTDGRGWRGRVLGVILFFSALLFLLLLTLARHAGEQGDIDMFAAAAREIQVRPLAGLLDLPALAYFFVSIGMIVIVAWKFAKTMGHFPRLRAHKLAVDSAQEDFEDVRIGMLDALERQIDEKIAVLVASPETILESHAALRQFSVDYENVVDQFKIDIREIRGASRLLSGVVRQHLSGADEEFSIDVAFDARIEEFESRLRDFNARVATLLSRQETSDDTIDTYRDMMLTLGEEKRRELNEACDKLRGPELEEYEALVGAEKVSAGDNVAWLATGRPK